MNAEHLKRYARFYTSARRMGADLALKNFLGMSADAVIPMSVSHGIDFGHCYRPFDVDAVEPLHWSYNSAMHEAASKVKPSVLAPHPWALVTPTSTAAAPKGTLVIGPPPSPENDERLYQLIKHDVRSDWAILVKARGNHDGSVRYWRSRGLDVVTADQPDADFYARLAGILAAHEVVIGCTFSSALVFAATLHKEIVLLRNYFYEAYEHTHYEEEVDLSSDRARKFVRQFADAKETERTALSRELLGYQFLGSADGVRAELESAIAALERPFYTPSRNPLAYWLRQTGASIFSKQGLLRYSTQDIGLKFRGRHCCIMRMNDIDVWLHGKNESNFSLTPVPFVPGVTEFGFAPGGYQAEHEGST